MINIAAKLGTLIAMNSIPKKKNTVENKLKAIKSDNTLCTLKLTFNIFIIPNVIPNNTAKDTTEVMSILNTILDLEGSHIPRSAGTKINKKD